MLANQSQWLKIRSQSEVKKGEATKYTDGKGVQDFAKDLFRLWDLRQYGKIQLSVLI
jgi:hypothetical protein